MTSQITVFKLFDKSFNDICLITVISFGGFFNLNLPFLNWCIITLQCCVSCCYTNEWVRYMNMYIASLLSLLPTPIPPFWKWKSSHSVVSDSLQLHGARQAPLAIGFSRQEYWGGWPFPSPGNLPNPGLNPGLPHCRQTLESEPPVNPCPTSLGHL